MRICRTSETFDSCLEHAFPARCKDLIHAQTFPRLSKIDTKCDTGNLGQRGLCVLKSRAEMVVAATSTGTKAFRKASAIVAEHAQDFGSNRLEGAKNLGKMIASGLSNLLKASRECL